MKTFVLDFVLWTMKRNSTGHGRCDDERSEEDRLNIMAEGECISRFFHDPVENTNKSPRTKQQSPSKIDLDSSQDLSQSSIQSDEELTLSQLDIQEQKPLQIQPFFNITPREMPLSPHYVFEEEFSANPWAMLIATIFLTKTSGKNARPYIKSFFEEFPTPYDVIQANPTSLERFFENLGLKKRGHMIWKLSYQFISSKWRRASDLGGIGKYGEDAYRIFCLGHTDLNPGDRFLKLYLDWLYRHTDFVDKKGIEDSEFVIEDPIIKYYRITLRDGDAS